MKKLSMLLALMLVCLVVLSSCSGEKPDDKDVTETTSEVSTTEVDEPLSPEEQKEHNAVQKVMYNLAMAETRDEIKPCVIQYSDDYADYVLAGLPDDDYIVEVKKLAEYKGSLIYEVICTCECDPEFIYSGIQMFSYTDDEELLINLDEDLETEICEKFVCDSCDGVGYTIEEAKTSGGRDKEIGCTDCMGLGFNFNQVTE